MNRLVRSLVAAALVAILTHGTTLAQDQNITVHEDGAVAVTVQNTITVVATEGTHLTQVLLARTQMVPQAERLRLIGKATSGGLKTPRDRAGGLTIRQHYPTLRSG